jgi:hypothetical protein
MLPVLLRESSSQEPPNSGSQSATTPSNDRSGLLAALGVLLIGAFLRSPAILLHGRVWAEESSIFLVGNWHRSFFEALLAPQFGYYSIWDNLLAAVAVHWLPLTLAAVLFTWSAVLVLLVTGYIVYEAEFLQTRNAKILGVVALLLIAPSLETWLNLINSEFYFGLWAAVILVSDASRLKLQRNCALALAVLSGPLTTLLSPLFIVRALLRRRRGETLQAVVVCLGSLAQVLVSVTTTTANRKVHLDFLVLGPVLFSKQILLLLLDRAVAKETYTLILKRFQVTTASELISWLLLFLAVMGLVTVLRRQRAAISLLVVAFWMAVLESLLALNGGANLIGPGFGERYAFTPNVVLGIAFLVAATAATPT